VVNAAVKINRVIQISNTVSPCVSQYFTVMWEITPQAWADKFVVVEGYEWGVTTTVNTKYLRTVTKCGVDTASEPTSNWLTTMIFL